MSKFCFREGTTWQKVETGTTVAFMSGRQLADGRVMLVGNSGLIAESADNGQSFVLPTAKPGKGFAALVEKPGGGFLFAGESGVTPLDPAMVLWTAVTGQSRSGAVIGPEERISPQRALEAMTIDAAWIYREEDSKGSISPGKLADFVVLDANPLAVPPDGLRELQVLATIKEGRLVAGKL